MPPKRKCLPSPEREGYVAAMREEGRGHIILGCKNRYADEFLRFCDEKFGHSDAKRVTANQMKAFAEHLSASCITLASARAKMTQVLAWFKWLSEHRLIEDDPGMKYEAKTIVTKTRKAG